MKKYSSVEDLELLSESALESSLAGFWDWDMTTNEEYLSPRFKQMFGYLDHELENKPESWQKIAYQEDLPKMFEDFNRHIKSRGEIPFNSIVRYHHKNGSTIWVKCSGKVVKWSENGEPLRAIGCHVDITEEKEMEIQLKKAVEERDTLLKEVHHRVKNNLQLLLSIARLKDKNGKIDTIEIEDSITSIAAAYEAIYREERFDKISIESYLAKIIVPIVRNQNMEFELNSVHLEQNIDFLIPIGLIIAELVNNSLKHGQNVDGKMKFFITIKQEDHVVSIQYRDNGKGYGDQLNAIKETNAFGLSIIKGLIDQLNGSIEFYDDNGACTLIKIKID